MPSVVYAEYHLAECGEPNEEVYRAEPSPSARVSSGWYFKES